MIDIARLRVRAKGAPFHGQGAKRELQAATHYMASRRSHTAVLQFIKEESH